MSQRFRYPTKAAAQEAAEHVGELLGLATARNRIGDVIATAKRGAPLPSVEDVQRRLGLGQDPDTPGITFGEARAAWLAGKRKLRPSASRRLAQLHEGSYTRAGTARPYSLSALT